MNRLKQKNKDPVLGVLSINYTYTAFGSRDTVTDTAGRSTSYRYDNRNRLEMKITQRSQKGRQGRFLGSSTR